MDSFKKAAAEGKRAAAKWSEMGSTDAAIEVTNAEEAFYLVICEKFTVIRLVTFLYCHKFKNYNLSHTYLTVKQSS